MGMLLSPAGRGTGVLGGGGGEIAKRSLGERVKWGGGFGAQRRMVGAGLRASSPLCVQYGNPLAPGSRECAAAGATSSCETRS